ncbi:RICIN domain-containing protein [Catenulispora subtropica]|uniref:Ricin B lectin domain-containing protein n=1 Tax=Catenulispora subtropica TaxID=450798 RepID=A0ABP5EXD4_9ACTN
MAMLRKARAWRGALGVAAAGGALVASIAYAPTASAWTGTYEIRNGYSGKCLELSAWNPANGARVDQWDCVPGSDGITQANERWTLVDQPDGQFQIRNAASGKCLEIQGWSQDDGAILDQWDCLYSNGHANANQEWYMNEAGQLQNNNSRKCLDVLGWATWNGATVSQWDCKYLDDGRSQGNQDWQMWGV